MATLIKTDGTETTLTPANGKSFSLDELQGFVGGYIEFAGLADGRQLVINEEGKLNGLDRNAKATALFHEGRDFTPGYKARQKAAVAATGAFFIDGSKGLLDEDEPDYIVGDVLHATWGELGEDEDADEEEEEEESHG